MAFSFKNVSRKFFTKETPKEHYLTLMFETGILQATLWELVGNRAEVICQSAQNLEKTILEDGISAANLAISALEQKEKNIGKVIFGVPNEWAENGVIRHEYTKFLKELTTQLALKPMGFVTIEEAVIFCINKEEGIPVTAILVHILKNEVVVSVSKIGKIEKIVRKKIEGTMVDAVSSAIRESALIGSLPSRILIFGENINLETSRQELISYPWLSKIEFLHFPKIDILGNTTAIKSVTYGGITEIVKNSKVKFIWNESLFINEFEKKSEPLIKQFEKRTTDYSDDIKDVTSADISKEEEILNNKLGEAKKEDLGFIQNQDILIQSDNLETVNDESFSLDKKSETEIPPPVIPKDEKALSKKTFKIPQKIKLPTIRISGINFSGLFGFFGKFNLFSGTKIAAIVIACVLFLLFIAGAVYWNSVKADIILNVNPKILEKEAEITISRQAALIDEKKMVIPAKTVEVIKNDSQTMPTTGVKIIGDRAKGEVTVYNKTAEGKVLNQGMVISTSDNLKFTLDNTASVSASVTIDTSGGVNITYGKQKISVTATTYGSKYNLNSGISFKMGDASLSSFEAKNEQSFSGGSSREVPSVVKEDQDTLLKSLSEKLLEQAKKELIASGNKNEKIIDQSIESVINKKQFGKNVDEESKDLSLNLEIKFTALVYNDQDLKSLMEKSITGEIPDDYTYKQENAENLVEVKSVNKDHTVLLKVKFRAKLLPKIDITQLQKGLRGKTYTAGKTYLDLYKNISSYSIDIRPKLPGFLYKFPYVLQNIKIEIKSQ